MTGCEIVHKLRRLTKSSLLTPVLLGNEDARRAKGNYDEEGKTGRRRLGRADHAIDPGLRRSTRPSALWPTLQPQASAHRIHCRSGRKVVVLPHTRSARCET